MTDQPGLFDAPAKLPSSVYHGRAPIGRGGATAKAGSDHIEAHGSGTIRQRVLDYLRGRGATGASDQEGARALNLSVVTYGPRRRELTKLGFVVDSGVTTRTGSGVQQKVWVAKGCL